jgi:RHS repeat-associated protein
MYNGHGDVVQTVSEEGVIENQYDYDIFGAPTLTIEQYSNSIRYTGEYLDNETGLYYLRARYYNSSIGRFLSEDSYWGDNVNPLSLNLYTYCLNDPIKFIDPSGHYSIELTDNGEDIRHVDYTVRENSSYTDNVYKNGSNGEGVIKIQRILMDLGYHLGRWGADGDFGNATKKAVIQFQKDMGIKGDGIVGKQTWSNLIRASERPVVPSAEDVQTKPEVNNSESIAPPPEVPNGSSDTKGTGKDEDGIYHARQNCWQQFGGYNDFYDHMFDLASDMKKAKFQFSDGQKEYILWAWKGDYINLGAGAELGIYKRLKVMNISTEHWVVDKSLALPISLKLSYSGKNVVNYNLRENQWWITGFNPEYKDMQRMNSQPLTQLTFLAKKVCIILLLNQMTT